MRERSSAAVVAMKTAAISSSAAMIENRISASRVLHGADAAASASRTSLAGSAASAASVGSGRPVGRGERRPAQQSGELQRQLAALLCRAILEDGAEHRRVERPWNVNHLPAPPNGSAGGDRPSAMIEARRQALITGSPYGRQTASGRPSTMALAATGVVTGLTGWTGPSERDGAARCRMRWIANAASAV